ncbi:cache domain-containing protein [Zooshikella harenae]|uniref:Cache domain-containing protein n=1 Tax=Zooshikella harenae TaxID=2827238 RepID=A0ABS5ZJZ0_9GAMM|nr:cache domain-containing protein [Zooshikella harenae]MBU2713307.1 cache domain-containing protein [Zooshikella harenae]
MKRYNILTLVSFLFLWANNALPQEMINTVNWPPYIDEKNPKGGFLIEVIDHVLKKANIKYSIVYNPSDRAHKNLNNPDYLATIPYFKSNQDNNLLLPRPFGAVSLVFYQLRGSYIKNYKTLMKYNLGILKSLKSATIFPKNAIIHQSKSYSSLFGLLDKNRTDLVLADRFAAEYFLSDADNRHIRNSVEELSPPHDIKPIYIAFNKNFPHSENFFKRFSNTLNQVIANGELIALYNKYNYKTMSSQLFTEGDIRKLINEAQEYIDTYGETKAFTEFRKSKSKFNYGEIYIFALNTKGILVAHPFPELDGKFVLNLKDKLGFPLIQEFLRVSKEMSEGWVNYWWKNPVTEKIQLKTTYVKQINDHLILGAGIYR